MHIPTTIMELQRTLDEAGVRSKFYSFVSDGYGERFRLAAFHDELGCGWHYYYAERGQRNDLITFRCQAEACAWFLEHILRDPSTRLPKAATPAPSRQLDSSSKTSCT